MTGTHRTILKVTAFLLNLAPSSSCCVQMTQPFQRQLIYELHFTTEPLGEVLQEIMRQESSLPVRNCLPQEACDTSGLSAGVQWRDDGLSNSSTHHSIHQWSDTWVDAAHITCQSGQKRISLFLVMIAWKTKYIIHLVLRTLEWRGNTLVWKA